MRVKVVLTEPIWRKAGSKQVEVELPADKASVLAVFGELVHRYPALGEDLHGDADELDSNYSLFVNNRLVRFAQQDEIEVKNGDEIAILLPMAGG